METGCEVGGRRREPWRRQTASRKHLSDKLEEILAAAREWHWESNRCGEVGGVREVPESDTGSDKPWYAGTETYDAWLGE